MDARLESRYLSSNYTKRNLFEDLIKLKTCLMISPREDAFHYLFTCPNYPEIRRIMMSNLNWV
jgi:hypothetical protein